MSPLWAGLLITYVILGLYFLFILYTGIKTRGFTMKGRWLFVTLMSTLWFFVLIWYAIENLMKFLRSRVA